MSFFRLDALQGEYDRAEKSTAAASNMKSGQERDLLKAEQELEGLKEKASDWRNSALELSGGRELEVTETEKELKVKRSELQKYRDRSAKELQLGLSQDEFESKIEQLASELGRLDATLESAGTNLEKAKEMVDRRTYVFLYTRKAIGRMVRRKFIELMKSYNLFGMMKINHDHKAMEVQVAHLGGDGAAANDPMPLSSFSGGERSRAAVCLILALWDQQCTPFRCLDEWDVYLDEKTRSRMEGMLIEHAADRCQQYVFISPQAPAVNDSSRVHVITIQGTNS